jgi:mannose-6-phosphate isomerase-like protein (cupin superfamily)
MLFLFGLAVLTIAAAQPQKGATVLLRESQLRGPVRPVDLSPLGKSASSELIAGPNSGLDSAYLIYTRVPAGARGPAMSARPVDEVLFVVSGQMNIQIGTDKLTANSDTAVFIPAGIPHEYWNAGAEPEAHIEMIAPGPAGEPLASLMKPAQPRKIENAAQYIRPAKTLAKLEKGLNDQWLVRRSSGSEHLTMHLDQELPGSGGPSTHIHPFNQCYFIISGTMSFEYGLRMYQAKANTFVIVPEGVVHRNWNDGPEIVKDIIMLFPEPSTGELFDAAVDVKKGEAPRF